MARAFFLQISGALVATLCQDQALKLVRVRNKVLHLLYLCVSLECPCFTYMYMYQERYTLLQCTYIPIRIKMDVDLNRDNCAPFDMLEYTCTCRLLLGAHLW